MKTMLIAGCSSGIGEHLFNYYKKVYDGAVYGISRSKEIICDCTDSVAVKRVISDIRPSILINCVGQASMNLALLSSTAAYDRTVTNNMKSTFVLCREAGKEMLRNKWGRIVNFGSCAVSMEIEGESLYAASKAAVVTFSRILARELAPHITVNTISCGPVNTRLIQSVDPDKVAKVIDKQVIKRYTDFWDIHKLCDFLISDNAEMITGQNIYINGAG